MSIDTSLRGFIDSNISNSTIKKELIKKLDDNVLTGTEISLIEKELQKADPKNAKTLIAEFENTLKSQLDISVPNIKESDFNASSFKFDVGNKKFVKENTTSKESSMMTDLLKDESFFKDNTIPRADKVKGKEVEPLITNFKDDTTPIEAKKFSSVKKEDVESFKKIFPDAKGMPPVLDEKQSNDFAVKTFGMNAKDLQQLVGENPTGKISPKTMFMIKEHMAKMSNDAQTFEDCQKVISQFDKFKASAKGIDVDPRFSEIEKNLKLKATNIVNDDINKQTSLSGIEGSIEKSNFLKKDKTDNLSFGDWRSQTDAVEIEPNNARLKGATSDRIKTIILNKIPSANLEELGDLKKYIDSKRTTLSEEDRKLLTSNIDSKITSALSAKIDNIKNSTDCLNFKYDLDNFKESLAPETLKIFKNQLATKSVTLLNKEIEGLKNPKPSDLKDIEKNLYYLKEAIPEGSFKPLENGFKVKDRISKIYGDDGINFKDIRQGELGDCYFMAALSSLAKSRPQDISKMISYNSDCSIIFVKFPGQDKPIGVKYPTQEELDKYAHNGKDGDVWVAAIEKAYAYTTAFRDGEGNKDNPRENITHGGSLGTGISVLTNNSVNDDLLLLTRDSTIRERVTKALASNKMVTVATKGTSDSHIIDNLPQNHAYTVIGYDPKTDKVMLRNPWGGGAAGDVDYRGKANDGVFEVSISEINKYFTNITYEE